MIIVQTPLRVSLFGGGTDFPAYYLEEGGAVLSTAIDKYIFVTIKKRFDRKLRIGYTRTEMVDSLDDIQHELIREAFRLTGIQEGVELTTMGDIPSEGSGLGSSSTVTVGALHAMYTFLHELVPAGTLAEKACHIERDLLSHPIGVQDQYIAAYGGFRFLEFKTNGCIITHKVQLKTDKSRLLNQNLLLFFTGITRRTATILSEQQANINQRKHILGQMKEIAYTACQQVETGNLDELGHLLHESWLLKQKLAGGISNEEVEKMYQTARQAGAIGGKLCGAGGGGFLLLYCPYQAQANVREALANYQELPFRMEPDGSKVIFNYRR